jgi:hypothetical protein
MAIHKGVWHGWPPQVWTGKGWKYVMADPCPECGKDRVLVGYRHLCASKPEQAARNLIATVNARRNALLDKVRDASVSPYQERIDQLEAEVKQLKRQLAKRLPVRQGRVSLTESNAQFDRKSYQREYMRKHRAKSKAEKRK